MIKFTVYTGNSNREVQVKDKEIRQDITYDKQHR